jgi:hypothetical protein
MKYLNCIKIINIYFLKPNNRIGFILYKQIQEIINWLLKQTQL